MTGLAPVVWAATFLLPLLGAVMIAVASSRAGARTVQGVLTATPVMLLPALVLTLLPVTAPEGAPATLDLTVEGLLLGTSLALDPLGRTLLLVAVLLYGGALFSLTFRHTERAPVLAAFLLVCFTGNALVYTAADATTFYLGYALMSFAAYGLVVHERTDDARRAGRVYLAMTVLSEFAVLAGLLLVVDAGGFRIADAGQAVAASPHATLIAALLVVGFGIKAGLLPVHVWLPLAHPAAPPAASAVLSGAMVKVGLIGWVRFLPLGEGALRDAGLVLVVLSVLGAFLAVPAGVVQRDPKTVLAYSTISQMGFLGAVVGVALAAPELAPAAISAAGVYAVHHGLAKGALFLGVPVWKHHARGRVRVLIVAGLALAGLVVAGAPFSSGSVGKYAAKYAVEGVRVAGIDLVSLLPLVATGTTILLLRFALLLWRTPADDEPAARDPEVWAWLALVVTAAVVPLLVTNRWLPVADTPDLDPVTLWDATWPILLGLALGAIGVLGVRRVRALARSSARSAAGGSPQGSLHRTSTGTGRGEEDPVIPPGDLVVVYERVAGSAATAFVAAGRALGRARERVVAAARGMGSGVTARAGALDAAEDGLGEWRGSGIALLVTLILLAVAGVVL